jgi:hypothetical protein
VINGLLSNVPRVNVCDKWRESNEIRYLIYDCAEGKITKTTPCNISCGKIYDFMLTVFSPSFQGMCLSVF